MDLSRLSELEWQNVFSLLALIGGTVAAYRARRHSEAQLISQLLGAASDSAQLREGDIKWLKAENKRLTSAKNQLEKEVVVYREYNEYLLKWIAARKLKTKPKNIKRI